MLPIMPDRRPFDSISIIINYLNERSARKQAREDAMLALGVVTGVALLGCAAYATKKTVEAGIDLVNKHILKNPLDIPPIDQTIKEF